MMNAVLMLLLFVTIPVIHSLGSTTSNVWQRSATTVTCLIRAAILIERKSSLWPSQLILHSISPRFNDDGVENDDSHVLDFLEDDLVTYTDRNQSVPFDYTSTRFKHNKLKSSLSSSDEHDLIAEEESASISDEEETIPYPKGTPEGFYIIKEYTVPSAGFSSLGDDVSNAMGITREEISRLDICSTNLTLPVALMLLDSEEYPSLSRARKACRKGYITIRNTRQHSQTETDDMLIRGRVGDRVFPGDIIGRQVRMHGGFYPSQVISKPPFDLPVIYQDDHFAIVNKPAGVVVYTSRNQGNGIMSIRSALPFVLMPPKRGVLSIIRRPASVHRLDKPTSGLLLVAKTKPAMVHLTRQFVERKIKKSYSAIINGIPDEPLETRLSSREAFEMGADVDPTSDVHWQVIDYTLEEKSATTLWRPVKYASSLVANDGTLTQVEMKLLTGRYHQLRRHFAWTKDCPLVGDKVYDGGGDAMKLRGRGLFLCSHRVVLDHPYYNTPEGREEWDATVDEEKKYAGGMIHLDETSNLVKVSCEIELPKKFSSLMKWEEERANKLGDCSFISSNHDNDNDIYDDVNDFEE